VARFGAANLNGEIIMAVSAIVGITALIGTLALFAIAGIILALIDKRLDAGREH